MSRSKHSEDEGGLWASIKTKLGLDPVKPEGISSTEQKLRDMGALPPKKDNK